MCVPIAFQVQRKAGETETTARVAIAALSVPTASDPVVERILELSRPGTDRPGQARQFADELQEIIKSAIRIPVRMLALAAHSKVLPDDLMQRLLSVANVESAPEAYRTGAIDLRRRTREKSDGPIRVHARRPKGMMQD